MLKRIYPPTFAGLLLLVLAVGVIQLFAPSTPPLPAAGVIVTAIAPLVFFLRLRIAASPPRTHPVLTSAAIGLGCVMIMIGIQRFGEQHAWLLQLGLASLIGWVIYQRWVWRGGNEPEQSR